MGSDIVHVWLVRAAEAAARLPRRWLSPEEEARARAFRRPQDEERFVASRLVARALLARELDVPIESLAVSRTCARCGDPSHGKPRLVAPRSDVSFSTSHSGDLVACAIGRAIEVGVDVEEALPEADYDDVAARCFPRDHEAWRALPPDAARRAFLGAWTRMEARLKLDGRGVVGLDDAAPDAERAWSAPLDLSPGYVGAIAATRAVDVVVREWSP